MRAAWAAGAVASALSIAGCHPNRGSETVACTAGASIWIGCSTSCGLGSCWGDPSIRVCDGEVPVETCNDDRALVIADDSEGICPSACPIARTVCPASGRITVTVQRGRGDYTCDWTVAERPLLDGDALPDASPDDAAIEDGAIDDAAIEDGAIDGAAIDDAAIDGAAIDDASIDAAIEDAPIDAPDDARGRRDT